MNRLKVTDSKRVRALTRVVALTAAAGLAGCSADYGAMKPDWGWWSRSSPTQPTMASMPTAARGEHLVGQDGACSEAIQPRGVALGMSECELIRSAGPTQNIQVGQNERGERATTIVYPQGEYAGSYQFRNGILTSVEAVAPPPAPAKPKAKPAKKPRKKPAAKPPGAPA